MECYNIQKLCQFWIKNVFFWGGEGRVNKKSSFRTNKPWKVCFNIETIRALKMWRNNNVCHWKSISCFTTQKNTLTKYEMTLRFIVIWLQETFLYTIRAIHQDVKNNEIVINNVNNNFFTHRWRRNQADQRFSVNNAYARCIVLTYFRPPSVMHF